MRTVGSDLWFSKCGTKTSTNSSTLGIHQKSRFSDPDLDYLNQKPWGRASNLWFKKVILTLHGLKLFPKASN